MSSDEMMYRVRGIHICMYVEWHGQRDLVGIWRFDKWKNTADSFSDLTLTLHEYYNQGVDRSYRVGVNMNSDGCI